MPKDKTLLRVLGCGASHGVPMAGNRWGDCDPNNPKNRRTRSSLAIFHNHCTVIIDTGPDFSLQMTQNAVEHIDCVLYTHAHGDHVNGMDDLRVYKNHQDMVIPIYGTGETIESLQSRFFYAFQTLGSGVYTPNVEPKLIHYGQKFEPVTGLTITPFEQNHNLISSTGYRIGNIAYSTDMIGLYDESYEILQGIDTWIIDCNAGFWARDKATVHANFEMVLEMNKKVGARQVYLSHLASFQDYDDYMRQMPEGYALSYDGLEIEVVL